MTTDTAHTMSGSGLDRRHQLAEEIAREAGALALDYFDRRDTLVIETKRDLQDVVSIADREVERLIRERIAAQFPDDGFLGEETGFEAGSSGYSWAVDPIDGTAPFVNGLPTWCVSIAVVHEDLPVVGVIAVPCTGELFSSAQGRGASLDGKRLTLDPARTIRNSLTGIGSNSHVSPEKAGRIITGLLAGGGNYIRNGSGALMLAYVAAGRLVGYLEPYMHAWDCLAGYCLVQEAGGRHLPFPLDGGNAKGGTVVLAANPSAWDDLFALSQ